MPRSTLVVRQKIVNAAVAGIMTAAVVLLMFVIDEQPAFRFLENKAYDGLYYVRTRINGAPQRDVSAIAMVAIDDRTFAEPAFKIPQILWHEKLAGVIMALGDAGAKAIGLDFLLPQTLFDDIVPNYSREWLKALVYARHRNAPVISGIARVGGKNVTPQSRYLQILGQDHIGLFNLTTDSDDFVRRQRLFFPKAGDPNQGMYSFAWLMAKAEKPDLSLPGEVLVIDFDPSVTPFSTYSLSDVYAKAEAGDKNWLAQRFKQRLVFIGETDTVTQDRHATPKYYVTEGVHKRTPGVEILAQTTATLLTARFFQDWRDPYRLVAYLVFAAVITFSTLFLTYKWFLFVTPALLAGWALFSYGAFIHYILAPVMGGGVAILVAQVLSFGYRHQVMDREKRKVRAVFQRYLPPKVVDRIVAFRDRDFLKGENRRLCVLFSDIRGFTTYSERRPPAEVVQRLNQYFDAMTEAVVNENGVVDKYLGDGILAFFGAFDDETPPALAGARAALNMMAALQKLNRQWSDNGEETFRIGIGLHVGDAMVGNIGSFRKMEYTVIGDAVNLASRLQDKSKVLGEDIIISENLCRDIETLAQVVDLGVVEIKGRAETRVFGLKGLRDINP
jgi:adenylate cyclase